RTVEPHGATVRVALPLDRPLAMTNVERALVSYHLTGAVTLRVGSLNGDESIEALDDAVPLDGSGLASIALTPAAHDRSWDARALVLDVSGDGSVAIDDVRLVRQFIVGANLAWLDGAYQHDFGVSFHHPTWGVTYTAEHTDAVLRFCQEHGIRLLRVW